MAEGHISPESRFRMPSLFDFVGKTMGKHLLSKSEYSEDDLMDIAGDTEDYSLFSKFSPEAYVKHGESQLTKSLFGMPQDELTDADRVFDISREGDADIFNISTGPSGQEYQKVLNRNFHGKLSRHADIYSSLLESGDTKGAEDFLSGSREKFMFKNPDTGELSYKFSEGLLGDVYLNPKGEFSDYWNIGLDKGEELGYGKNLQRAIAAPFTKPPTIRGSVSMDASAVLGKQVVPETLDVKSFYGKLFEDQSKSTEDMLIDEMALKESIF
jgi:hypothetical protein|tara:strand:+ start:37 stop:846 length:810 start_codon:yes stop_codon:yes gene_type:complete